MDMMKCDKHPEAGEMDKDGMMKHWEEMHQGEPMPAEAGEMPAEGDAAPAADDQPAA